MNHFEHLQNKWQGRSIHFHKKLWAKHKKALTWLSQNTKQLAAGTYGSFLLFAAPVTLALPSPHQLLIADHQHIKPQTLHAKESLISQLSVMLPQNIRPLTIDEEQKIGQVLSDYFHVTARVEIFGKRLNRSYGIIGAEQHLARYPGDSMNTHFDTLEEANQYYSSGMAPGLGAWGYFAPSKTIFTQKDKEREKYYVAVQTFLVPDYNNRVSEYRDFFQFRKMLVVNPQNGKAVAVVIGDAGPAEWTGKHLGGSPEVMRYLERVDGALKGPVLYFFLDDPNDSIPLGPITVQ